MSFVRKHPIVSFFTLAYGLSWMYWIPLAIADVRVSPGSRMTHFPGLLGPALAAFVVTALTSGRRGVLALARALVFVPRPLPRFCFYALTPLIFLAIALLAAIATRTTPPLSDFALYSGLPPLGLPVVVFLVVLCNGFGEETGWRGFALTRLQHRFGALKGTFVLAVLWAAWHTPIFFVVETYRDMTLPMLVGGFGLGICAGALVLSRVAQRTHGSILAPALWHAGYNMSSATAASRGIVAAVVTTAVMAWAVALLIAARRDGGRSTLLVRQPL